MVPVGDRAERDVDLCPAPHQSCASLGGKTRARWNLPYTPKRRDEKRWKETRTDKLLPLRTFKRWEASLQSKRKTTKTSTVGPLELTFSVHKNTTKRKKFPKGRLWGALIMPDHNYSNNKRGVTNNTTTNYILRALLSCFYPFVSGVVCRCKSDESNICWALREVKTETFLKGTKVWKRFDRHSKLQTRRHIRMYPKTR